MHSRHYFALGIAFASLILLNSGIPIFWHEEIPLNTGESLWALRSGKRSFRSAQGNGLDFGLYEEAPKSLKFEYRGAQYKYSGDSEALLLSIDAQGRPFIVASPSFSVVGDRIIDPCAQPFYVVIELAPGGTVSRIAPLTDRDSFGRAANLTTRLPKEFFYRSKLSAEDRARQQDSLGIIDDFRRINSSRVSRTFCSKKV